MTEKNDDTLRTRPLPEIHAVPDDVVSDTSTVVDEQYFIDAARAGKPVRDIDLARWYIKHYRILRVAHYEEIHDVKRLTICHTWRVERYPDHRIRLYIFDLEEGQWKEKDNLMLMKWPTIPLHSSGLNWVFEIVNTACAWALVAARTKLPDHCHGEKWPAKHTYEDFTSIHAPGYFETGARALHSLIWEHFIDDEVQSAVVGMYGTSGDLVRYLHHAQYRDSLIKVAREHQNLLPLLRLIYPQSWGQDELFAKKLWYRNGRAYTALDRYPYKLGKRESSAIRIIKAGKIVPHHLSFAEADDWNWLRRAPVTAVRTWVAWGARPEIIALFAEASKNQQVSTMEWIDLLQFLQRFDLTPEHTVQMTRFVRLYLEEYAQKCSKEGKDTHIIIRPLLDWLLSEGLAQGYPQKNATWHSLQRRKTQWHRRIAHEKLQAQMAAGEKIRWESALPETVIDGIVFRPINDGKTLVLEGHEVDHCIASYINKCQSGIYRVYAVREPDGTRSTLGISIEDIIQDPGVEIALDQHCGPRDQTVSDAAERAGRKLVEQYREAFLAQLLNASN